MIASRSALHEQGSYLYIATPEDMAYQHHSGCILRGADYLRVLNMSVRPQCLPVDLLYCIKLAGIEMGRGNLLRVASCEYYGQINIDKCLPGFSYSAGRPDFWVGIFNLCFLDPVACMQPATCA